MNEELETILESKDTPTVSEKSLGKRIADAYFEPKSFEKWKNGKFYELLGVKYVQKLVMGTIGRKKREAGRDYYTSNYFIGKSLNDNAFRKFELETRFNEKVHAVAANVFALFSMVYLEIGDHYTAAFSAGATMFNSSLCMLQRYNRARVCNVLEKRYGKENGGKN